MGEAYNITRDRDKRPRTVSGAIGILERPGQVTARQVFSRFAEEKCHSRPGKTQNGPVRNSVRQDAKEEHGERWGDVQQVERGSARGRGSRLERERGCARTLRGTITGPLPEC